MGTLLRRCVKVHTAIELSFGVVSGERQGIHVGFGIDIVYLDYRKAFDTVPHHILLQKIMGLGLSKEIYNWIRDFLQDRKMKVYVLWIKG